MNTLARKGKFLSVICAAVMFAAMGFAEPPSALDSVAAALETAAGDVGGLAVGVIAAGVALFATLFGLRYLKKALNRTA